MVFFKNNYKYILSFFINFTIFANVINANVLVLFSFSEASDLVSFSNPFSRFSFQSFLNFHRLKPAAIQKRISTSIGAKKGFLKPFVNF
jgi:hypothetical protein